MNNVILIGRLTKDPEARDVNDTVMSTFTLAVDKDYGDGADFIPVICFGKTAQNVHKYLEKGRKVAVAGNVQSGSYTRKDGTKAYTIKVKAYRIDFLDWGNNQNKKNSETKDTFEEVEEDAPF